VGERRLGLRAAPSQGTIGAANSRFDVFVRELALFNRRHGSS
jgi:hypothetical protein